MMKRILLLIVVVVLTQCKQLEKTMPFTELGDNKGWYFYDKVKLKPSTGKFVIETYSHGKAKLKSVKLVLQAVPESRWEVEQEKRCESPMNIPMAFLDAKLNGQRNEGIISFGVQEEETYYLVIKDCKGWAQKQYKNVDLNLLIKIKVFNNDKPVVDEQPAKEEL